MLFVVAVARNEMLFFRMNISMALTGAHLYTPRIMYKFGTEASKEGAHFKFLSVHSSVVVRPLS